MIDLYEFDVLLKAAAALDDYAEALEHMEQRHGDDHSEEVASVDRLANEVRAIARKHRGIE